MKCISQLRRALLVTTAIALSVPGNASASERIIFMYQGLCSGLEWYAIAPDGSGLQRVTQLPHGLGHIGVNWSPDQTLSIGASRVDPYNVDIFVADLSSGEITYLTGLSGENVRPAWAPDGRRIVFQSDRNLEWDLYVYDLLESVETNLTQTSSWSESRPQWSPDGQRIAFQSDRNGNWDIYVLDLNSGDVHQVTSQPGDEAEPLWSPDGTKVAYTAWIEEDREVFCAHLQSGALVNLSNRFGRDWKPAWSSDGEWIAFSSHGDGHEAIYVVKPDGTHLQKLTRQLADPGFFWSAAELVTELVVGDSTDRPCDEISRVAGASCPAPAPSDPSVRISRTRLLR